MDKHPRIVFILLIASICGTAGLAVYHWTARKDFQHRNAELDARVHDLQREREAAVAKNEALGQQLERAGATEQQLRDEADRQAKELAVFRQREEERRNPAPGKATCIDSDAKLKEDAIYVRGSVEVGGGGRSFDHCRLGQLVEFQCLENPAGSGRFISDAKMIDCPAGSRCVSGECLR